MAHGDDATKVLETAKAFRPRILAERDRIESDRRLPDELARELAKAGFFRIFLPAAYGGLDLSPVEAIDIYEELARADASVAWCVWNGNVHWTTARLPQDVAKLIFGDPDMILANSTRPSGRATVVDGERMSAERLVHPPVRRVRGWTGPSDASRDARVPLHAMPGLGVPHHRYVDGQRLAWHG